MCNDFINDRKHAVILEHNCLKQKRVLRETLYISVCHMIGRGEYEGKLVPKVEMNCIKWNFAGFFFFFHSSVLANAPYGPLQFDQTTSFFRVPNDGGEVALWSMNWFQVATWKLLCVIGELSLSDGHFVFKLFQPMNTEVDKSFFFNINLKIVIGPFVKSNYDMWAADCFFYNYYYYWGFMFSCVVDCGKGDSAKWLNWHC